MLVILRDFRKKYPFWVGSDLAQIDHYSFLVSELQNLSVQVLYLIEITLLVNAAHY